MSRPEADPRPPGELEADPGRLGDGGRQAPGGTTGLPGRFEHDEERLRAPGERREPAEPVGDAGRTIRGGQPAAGQVEDQEVDRAPGQQHAPDSEALVERLRGDDDEPLEADPAGDGLDRVEAAREIEPGHDRALGLGLGREPQDERRPAARTVAADRDTRRSREAAWPQDRVERCEAGVDDAVVVGAGLGHAAGPRGAAPRPVTCRLRGQRERSDDPRSCGTPPGPEARDSGVHISTRGRHRTTRLEHLF